jgi:LacI family transcriptional regulator
MNLKQLADHLKLSPTTVSRALNGYPEVSEATRARVAKAARDLRYRPSHHAQRLAQGQSKTIGHVIPHSQHTLLGAHFADIMAGASEACASLGYEMLFSMVDDADEEALYRDLATSGRVDGVILHGPLIEDRRIHLLTELQLPFVVHGRSSAIDLAYDWLDVNNLRAIQRATEFLLDLGHTQIALLNGIEHMNYAARRRRGFVNAFTLRGMTPSSQLMFTGELTEAYGYSVMGELMRSSKPPTAVVSSGILIAFGALRAAQAQSLSVGQDVSIVTYDDQLSYLQNSGDIPLFTSVRSSIKAAGRRIIEMLVERINNADGTTATELWEAELVIGRSTAPPG